MVMEVRKFRKRTAGALDHLENKVDAVLTDICMPIMNGIELNQHIDENILTFL